ncbi:MAG: histidine ammonia-lyase [Thermoprotei archaeon]
MPKTKELILDGSSLTIRSLVAASQGKIKVRVSPRALAKVRECREYVLKAVSQKKPVYGVNTGFGKLAEQAIDEKDVSLLQLNLVRSHAAGVGPVMDTPIVRAAMILRLNTLLKGFSGISVELVELLKNMVNVDIVPIVPRYGSLGASGDLAPLSYIALSMIGEGNVLHKGKVEAARSALAKEGLKPLVLGAKEGLALINGTQMSCATACAAYVESVRLLDVFDMLAAFSYQALRASREPLDVRIHALRPLSGQMQEARRLNALLEGSSALNGSHRVQEPYSLRCVPQVHGAARQALSFVEDVLTTEINSVTDNPIIFADDHTVLSGGNFHGQPVALCCDMLSMSLVPVGHLSEKRVEKILDNSFSGLPAFLASQPGLDSGFMIAQYTAAAVLEECKLRCTPSSVDTASVSGGQEDHASMSLHASQKALEIVRNLWHVAAVEALCAFRAIELANLSKALSPETSDLYRSLGLEFSKLGHTAPLGQLISASEDVLRRLAGANS